MSDQRLIDDVKGVVGSVLVNMQTDLLKGSADLTPTMLVTTAIGNTLTIIENHFELNTRLVTSPEGLPVTVSGLVTEYWEQVNSENSTDPRR